MKTFLQNNIVAILTVVVVLSFSIYITVAPKNKITSPIVVSDDSQSNNNAGSSGQAGATSSRDDLDHPTQCVLELATECDISVNACGVDSRDCE